MVRATSLQNHLALEALRSQYGESLHVTFLFRAVYLTYLLRDVIDECCETDVFREAEAALYQCSCRGEAGGPWQLADTETDALKIVLALHDAQLQAVPAHTYALACERLLNYLTKRDQPLIPAAAGDAGEACEAEAEAAR
jgi:hypothetical protein